MQFETGHIYHIYNQGNNRQKIFFNRENYLFFLKKINNHILPFADILAWCLMPNHFHIMAYVNYIELPTSISDSVGVTSSHPDTKPSKPVSLNNSIGAMLRSYTRAINNQENRTGSLFREETKANCLTKPDKNFKVWYTKEGITHINVELPEKQYPNICFNYIINNPVKDGLVTLPEEWEFSSYLDILGKRNGNLINRERIKEYELQLVSG
jgi:putative transposase